MTEMLSVIVGTVFAFLGWLMRSFRPAQLQQTVEPLPFSEPVQNKPRKRAADSEPRITTTNKPPQFEAEEHIYFIGSPSTGKVKIGVSKNPKKRLETLQVCSPTNDLVLLATIEGDVTDERALHSMYNLYQDHSEWYWLVGDLAEYVNSLEFVSLDTILE